MNPVTGEIEQIDEEMQFSSYLAERILNKRIQNNKIEYLVKWSSQSDHQQSPSWELEENLDCADLIFSYEETREKQNRSRYSKEPEAIIGCTDNKGFMQFLIKWKGVDQADLVPAKEAKIKFPKTVQEFYKERLNLNQKS